MSSARPDTWMPLYWGDYARDTGHLNAAGHGAYLMLIKHYWCSNRPLPDDDNRLWRIACCDSKREWLTLRPILAEFFNVMDGLWRHGRIDRELERANHIATVRREAGSRGGKQSSKTRANEQQTLEQNPTHARASSHPQSQSQEASASEKIPRARTRSAPDPDPDFEVFWLAYPRRVAKPRAFKAWRKAVGRAPPAEIIAAAERFAAASAGKDPEFLPHPASWLNDDRFNDPPPKPAGDPLEVPEFLRRRPASATDRALAGIAAVAAKLGEAGNGAVTPGRGTAADSSAEQGGANGRDRQSALVIEAMPGGEAVDHARPVAVALPDARHERD